MYVISYCNLYFEFNEIFSFEKKKNTFQIFAGNLVQQNITWPTKSQFTKPASIFNFLSEEATWCTYINMCKSSNTYQAVDNLDIINTGN